AQFLVQPAVEPAQDTEGGAVLAKLVEHPEGVEGGLLPVAQIGLQLQGLRGLAGDGGQRPVIDRGSLPEVGLVLRLEEPVILAESGATTQPAATEASDSAGRCRRRGVCAVPAPGRPATRGWRPDGAAATG